MVKIVVLVLMAASLVSAEHHFQHHEPATSYQSFHLHVGHQVPIKIPVVHHYDHQESLGSGHFDHQESLGSGHFDHQESLGSGRFDHQESLGSGHVDHEESLGHDFESHGHS